jgi:hypothetical protein
MTTPEICPLCQRVIPSGYESSHHLIPRTFKGKQTVNLHKICHNKLHSVFTERELFKWYNSIERITEHEEIKKFILWVRDKKPEFYVSHRDHNVRLGKRKK